jgi:hypothetical protein
MLKIIFWLLAGANAALFAYQGGYLDSFFPSGREPTRMSHQINADKIRLLPANAGTAAAASSIAAAASSATSANTAMPVAVNTARKADMVACTEIGNFTPMDAKRFSTQLASLSLGEHLSQRTVQEVASHLVYIPPQGDKDGADKKAGELRRLGVNDFYVIQDNSSLRWGISLGVFKSEEAARQHLANLNQKGVRTARIGERSVTSNAVVFRVKDLDVDAKAALDKVKAGFPKQEMRACDTAV